VLNADGTKAKTLYLPPPDRKNPKLEWETKGTKQELLDGSERMRVLGYLPVLTLKWSAYDDRPGQGYTLGTADGQRPTLEQLLQVLSGTPGTLRVSAGPAPAGGFTCGEIKVGGAVLLAPGIGGDLQIVFRGRQVLSSRYLEAF
jgi:hypothetical protein